MPWKKHQASGQQPLWHKSIFDTIEWERREERVETSPILVLFCLKCTVVYVLNKILCISFQLKCGLEPRDYCPGRINVLDIKTITFHYPL